MQAVLMAMVVSVLTVGGQAMWKLGLTTGAGAPGLKQLLVLLFSPSVLAGTALYGTATILWLYMLPRYNLSYVYPLMSITYIFSFLVAVVVFKEAIPMSRWLGVVTICLGIYLTTKA